MKPPKAFQLSAAIREAIGLSAEEKAFLWNIASHQTFEEFSARQTLCDRTGLTDWKLRRVIKSLDAAGLIKVERRRGTTTKYRIRYAALDALKDPANPLAVAAKASRRKPTTANNTTPRGIAASSHVGSHRDRRGGAQHQKSEPEEVTVKNQKNGRGEGAAKRRERIIPSGDPEARNRRSR
ncbi:hypothetical protein [Microbacterium laevaniformans]|uniref:hypothetical protein n=1 Tax=Microbacterium laevaniformans TaxID=36807 RepID=UPI0012FB0A16|nr:hypothetical protein [Microbacterium laevaniformans]